METGVEDAKSYILRRLGIYEYPYMKGKFSMNVVANYYNFESGAVEPLIEPWYLNATIRKVLPNGLDREGVIAIESDKNFNLNLTYGVALVIKKTLDNILNDNTPTERVIKEEFKTEDIGEEDDEIMEFTNNLGCDLQISVEGYQSMLKEEMDSGAYDEMMAVIELPKSGAPVTIHKRLLLDITKKVTNTIVNSASSLQKFILRMDATMEGMEIVKSIPVELSGIRSYQLTQTISKSGKESNLSMVVSVKSKANGQVFQISFESPVILANNCHFPVSIGSIQESELKNPQGKDKIEKFSIEPNKTFAVPLEWLILDKCILYQRTMDNEQRMEMLMYKIGSTILTPPSDYPKIAFKSQYFNFKKTESEDINFAFDLYAFKCKPLQMQVPQQILMSFNPPICFKNLLFGDLILQRESDCHQLLKLKPEEYNYVYDTVQYNSNQKDKAKIGMPKYSWILQKDRTTKIATVPDFLFNESQDVILHSFEHLDGKSSTTYDLSAVNVKFEANDFEVRNNEYDNFKLREMIFSSTLSKKVIIYTPYMIVNKTNISLVLGNGKKRNDLELHGNSTEYFNPGKEEKLFIKAEDYSWSKEFSFSTVGVSGELSLKRTKTGQSYLPYIKNYNSNEIDIGVNIAQLSTKFYKTIAITFAPRYIITNRCKDPLIVVNNHKNSKMQLFLNPGQEKVYFFENKIDIGNCLSVRNPHDNEVSGQNIESISNIPRQEWSSVFEIHDIADFQIGMSSSEESKELAPHKMNFPYMENGKNRYIRVIVTTKDDATLFVVFSDPYRPE